jgi:hypothetical protein
MTKRERTKEREREREQGERERKRKNASMDVSMYVCWPRVGTPGAVSYCLSIHQTPLQRAHLVPSLCKALH